MLTGEADNSFSCENWSPPLFTHYENLVPTQDNQTTHNAELVSHSQDIGNSLQTHRTVTRSGQVVRPRLLWSIRKLLNIVAHAPNL